MSDYTKTTDFAAKDALLTGNPSKVVLGSEIDAEFEAIETAVNSKLDDVLTTRGDLLYEGASGEARLAKGARGAMLRMNANDPEWVAVGSAGYILRSDGTDPAWHQPIYGLLMYRTVDTAANAAGWNTVNFGANTTEVYDHIGHGSTAYWEAPTGYTWMRATGQVAIQADAAGYRGARIANYNGGSPIELTPTASIVCASNGTAGAATRIQVDTGWRIVIPGDQFVLEGYHSGSTDPTLTMIAEDTWVAVEFR